MKPRFNLREQIAKELHNRKTKSLFREEDESGILDADEEVTDESAQEMQEECVELLKDYLDVLQAHIKELEELKHTSKSQKFYEYIQNELEPNIQKHIKTLSEFNLITYNNG